MFDVNIIWMKPLLITSIDDARQHAERCKEKMEICRDAIKLLRGTPTDGMSFVLNVKDKPVLKFDIHESEADVSMSYFVYLLQCFGKQLDNLNRILANQTSI